MKVPLSLPHFTLTQYAFPLIVFVVAICLQLLPQNIQSLIVYDRHFIIVQQWWRLISGHFIHTNFNHLGLNLAGATMLLLLHGHFYRFSKILLLYLFSALFISIMLFNFDLALQQYVGLSGILHAVFSWGALKDIQHGEKTGYWLCLGVALKVAHEQFYGASAQISQLINAQVAINAHFYGMIAGLIFFLTELALTKEINMKKKSV